MQTYTFDQKKFITLCAIRDRALAVAEGVAYSTKPTAKQLHRVSARLFKAEMNVDRQRPRMGQLNPITWLNLATRCSR